MRPMSGGNYERVECGDFLNGVIDMVAYDEKHEFTYQGKKNVAPAVRFKLIIDGYEWPKYSRWMRFTTGARSNLYKMWISSLVADATPNIDFDFDEFNGMKIKAVFTENDAGFQNVALVQPMGKPLTVEAYGSAGAPPAKPEAKEEPAPKPATPNPATPNPATPKPATPKTAAPKKAAPKRPAAEAAPPKPAPRPQIETNTEEAGEDSLADLFGGDEGAQDDIDFDSLG